MLVSAFYIKDGISRLRATMGMINKSLEKAEETKVPVSAEEIKTYKQNFHSIIDEMMNGVEEFLIAIDTSHNPEITNVLLTMKATANLTTKNLKAMELSDLYSNMRIIASAGMEVKWELFEKYRYTKTFSGIINKSAPLCQETLRAMVGAINTPNNREYTLIDPMPREGINIPAFRREGISSKLYAAGGAENKLAYLKSRYDRVALGSLRGSNISNDVFDLMFLYPEVSLEKPGERILIKQEKDLIRDTAKYLREGGYLLLVIPAFRMYKDLSLVISKLYKNIQIRKAANGSYFSDGLVYILAERRGKDDKDIDEPTYRLLRRLYKNEDILTVYHSPIEEVALPESSNEIKLFRGSVLNKDELEDLFNNSGMMRSFWNSQQKEKMSDSQQSPLLPFNVGQLGLVLTSGCLDGVIDEGNGNFHVVKGRVVKKTDTIREENEEKGEIEYIETTSNRVEINVITADGTLKVLA